MIPPPLPPSNLRSIFDGLCWHLQADGSVLKSYVNTWLVSAGSDADDLPPAVWTTDLMPLVSLEIGATGGAWYNQVTQRAALQLAVKLAVEGTDHRDLLDFWEVFVARLYPQDQSLYAKLKPFGVMAHTVTGTGISRVNHPTGRSQVASGVITCNYEFRTKY